MLRNSSQMIDLVLPDDRLETFDAFLFPPAVRSGIRYDDAVVSIRQNLLLAPSQAPFRTGTRSSLGGDKFRIDGDDPIPIPPDKTGV